MRELVRQLEGVDATLEAQAKRIAELEAALRAVVSDIEEYQQINNLFPSPGKPDCWQSVTRAKSVLRNSGSN